MSPEQAFGAVLRELRRERGWSQEEFADRCRISRPHVSRLETGRNSPSLSMLFQIAGALSIPEEELVRLTRERISAAGAATPHPAPSRCEKSEWPTP